MRNADGQTITLPTTQVVEVIRQARITQALGVKDNATGEPAGVALFSGDDLRLILTPAEMEAVADLLTIAEMETLFTNTQKGA